MDSSLLYWKVKRGHSLTRARGSYLIFSRSGSAPYMAVERRSAAKPLFVETALTLLGALLCGHWSQLDWSLSICPEDRWYVWPQISRKCRSGWAKGSSAASSCVLQPNQTCFNSWALFFFWSFIASKYIHVWCLTAMEGASYLVSFFSPTGTGACDPSTECENH